MNDDVKNQERYVAEKYSENYALASKPAKKKEEVNTKLVSTFTILITAIIVMVARFIRGVKIIKDDIIIGNDYIECNFELKYSEKNHLYLELTGDDYYEIIEINDTKINKRFDGILKKSTYTIEIKDNDIVVYTKTIQTSEE